MEVVAQRTIAKPSVVPSTPCGTLVYVICLVFFLIQHSGASHEAESVTFCFSCSDAFFCQEGEKQKKLAWGRRGRERRRRTHFGSLKYAQQGKGYCWRLLALGRLFLNTNLFFFSFFVFFCFCFLPSRFSPSYLLLFPFFPFLFPFLYLLAFFPAPSFPRFSFLIIS